MNTKDLIEKLNIYGVRKFLRHILFEFIYRWFYMRLIKGSYSQIGEDIIIDRLLKNKKRGFYVDVGAYDPMRFSNTLRFYKKGWRGINIEPDPDNYQKFLQARKRDINLNIGISDKKDMLIFYKFFPDTLSTFSKKSAKENLKHKYRLINESKIQVKKLSGILGNYCKDKKIDFMSIDTEGFDERVLKGNNWNKFKPKLICVESIEHGNTDIKRRKKVLELLARNGYKKATETMINTIFLLR